MQLPYNIYEGGGPLGPYYSPSAFIGPSQYPSNIFGRGMSAANVEQLLNEYQEPISAASVNPSQYLPQKGFNLNNSSLMGDLANVATAFTTGEDTTTKLQNGSRQLGYAGLNMLAPGAGLAAQVFDGAASAIGSAIENGYEGSGANNPAVSKVLKGIPILNGAVSFSEGLNNRMYGSKLNHDFIDNKKAEIGNNVQHFNQWNSNDLSPLNLMSSVNKSQVGKDAHQTFLTKHIFGDSDTSFSNLAAKTTDKLNRQINATNTGNINRLNTQINQIDNRQAFNQSRNMFAEGGWTRGKQIAIPFIQENEGWRNKPYADGKNLRSVGYGFNDGGFRAKYKDGISRHYENGITKQQAKEEMNWYLDRAVETLSRIYDKFDLTDNQKASILDTYYQRPASVTKGSKFYSLLEKGDPKAWDYLGVDGFSKRNNKRRGLANRNDIDAEQIEQEVSTPLIIPQNAQQNYYTNQVDPLEFSAEGIVPTNRRIPIYDGIGESLPTQVNVNATPTVEDIEALYQQYMDNNAPEQGVQYAKGGRLINTSNVDNNKLTYINEGSSHESNPNSGVQIGTDEQGNPNLVEEGEVIANNNYVFSNRLKISDEFAKKYGLKKNSTFAEAIKSLDDSYQERENDRIEKAGLDDNIETLTREQEATKEKQQQERFNALQQAYNGYINDSNQELIAQQSPQGIEQLITMQQPQQFGLGGYLMF